MKLPSYILSIDNAFGDAEWRRSLGGNPEDVYVAQRYKLLDRIGRGSFGAVYAAYDCDFQRKVAVKIMPLVDPDVAHREGRALAALSHRNVVSVFDHGMRDDYRWLVLELLEGPTLAEWSVGKEPAALLERYLEAGEGLAAAHRQGLVHFDFKPSNVRIAGDGRAVVVDFGMARNLESLSEEDESEGWGGTLEYIAPERLRGAVADTRSDQFSFCVALWEALAGENPFGPPEISQQQRYMAFLGAPQGSPMVSRRVRRILARGMSVIPGERWPSMAWMLDALRGSRPRHPGIWLAGFAFVLGLVLAIVFVRPKAKSSVLGDTELPEVEMVSLEALGSAERGDYDGAAQALQEGYSVAREQGLQREYARVSAAVAEKFESAGLPHEAADAWLMTVKLSRERGDTEAAEHAKARILALTQDI